MAEAGGVAVPVDADVDATASDQTFDEVFRAFCGAEIADRESEDGGLCCSGW